MDSKIVFMEPGKTWGYEGKDLREQCITEALKELNSIQNPIDAGQLAYNCELANHIMLKHEVLAKYLNETNINQIKQKYRLDRLKRSLTFFKLVRHRFMKKHNLVPKQFIKPYDSKCEMYFELLQDYKVKDLLPNKLDRGGTHSNINHQSNTIDIIEEEANI